MLHPVPFVYHKLGYAVHVGEKPAYHKDVMIAGIDKMRRGEVDENREYINKIDDIAAKHKGMCILLAHQGISEAHKFASEISAQDLPKNFDYYAMGHIHERSEWNFDFLGGPVAYPGSIEVIGNVGTGDAKKGLYIVDISSGKAVTNWIQLDTRKQVRINANAKSLEVQIDKLVKEMDNDGQKPIVDLRLNDVANPEMIRAQLARLEGRAFHTSWREQLDIWRVLLCVQLI